MENRIKSNPLFQRFLNWHFIPENDPNQALRLRRFFMATIIYILCFSLCYISYLAGIMEWQPIGWNMVLIPLVNITFYILFRTGLNLKMADPSLTLIQLCTGIFLTSYGIYFANEARAVLLLCYVIIFLFGIFRLNTGGFLFLTVFTLLNYGAEIILLHIYRADRVNFQVEYLQFVVLTLVLVAFSIIGGYISALRRNLGISRAELQKSIAIIKELSIHDELTGVYNRRHFMELLEYEKSRSSRGGSLFSIVMLDIDEFKEVNDAHGHLVGDEILRIVTKSISNALRSTDFCGRYGGDEFLLVLTQTDINAAIVCAERVCSSIEQTSFPDLEPGFKITVSQGVTEYHVREDIDKMIARADEALYRAKKSGRNRLEYIV